LVRQRRRKRGLPVVPAGKALPFLSGWDHNGSAEGAALDAAAEAVLVGDTSPSELDAARVRLAERRITEALFALEEAGLRDTSAHEVVRLEQIYAHEPACFEQLCSSASPPMRH